MWQIQWWAMPACPTQGSYFSLAFFGVIHLRIRIFHVGWTFWWKSMGPPSHAPRAQNTLQQHPVSWIISPHPYPKLRSIRGGYSTFSLQQRQYLHYSMRQCSSYASSVKKQTNNNNKRKTQSSPHLFAPLQIQDRLQSWIWHLFKLHFIF